MIINAAGETYLQYAAKLAPYTDRPCLLQPLWRGAYTIEEARKELDMFARNGTSLRKAYQTKKYNFATNRYVERGVTRARRRTLSDVTARSRLYRVILDCLDELTKHRLEPQTLEWVRVFEKDVLERYKALDG